MVHLQNTATGYDSLLWDLGDLGTSSDISPTITFPDELPEAYEVCQYVFASPTCFDSTCVIIEVGAGISVFVPNAFSPDGNGYNDEFLPFIGGVLEGSYEFRIFDRWGNLVFFSNQPGEAWDGNFNGKPAKQDVYVWRLIAQDAATGLVVEDIGHVTLVR